MKQSFLMLFLCAAFSFAQQQATGYVFEDANKNGIKDRKEKGIANVSVSNGVEVVKTDETGKYALPVENDNIIFVIKPANYATPKSNAQLPQFYYIHKPEGSPKDMKYAGVKPTGKLQKEINFPLYAQKENTQFKVLVFGDPQPYDEKEIDYFRRGIINEVKNNKKDAVFGISLGDLVGDDLSLHPLYIDTVKEIGLPWYNVMGNHDMNYEAKEDKLSDETFEANFGPNNYAFNYGNVHFIVLDDILYPDPRDGKSYWGGFRKDQLDFVENDLKNVNPNQLVVFSFHIQLTPENDGDKHFRMEDRKRLFEILKPFQNVLMMSAHTHKQTQLFYGKKEGWEGIKPIHEFNAGTTSGDWYSGTVDELGVPKSVMRDGTERGYSFVNFNDNQYEITYKVAGKPEDYQINLWVPKVIPFKTKNAARIVANFFMGSKQDKVEYRIDNGEWKEMDYTESIDPDYTNDVLKWDTTQELFTGRRPSNPEASKHIWTAPFSRKLELGTHEVEVRAKDRYGKTYTAKSTFEVKNSTLIP